MWFKLKFGKLYIGIINLQQLMQMMVCYVRVEIPKAGMEREQIKECRGKVSVLN